MLTKKDKELYPILLELRKNIEAAIKDRIDNRDYYLKNKQDDFLQVYVEELSKKIYDYLFVVKNPD